MTMTANLYRYPHPTIPDKWLYVGQGPRRDREHRSGKSSFGRRFKRFFPNTPLPQPTRWTEIVESHIETNELETIAMFRYHTWHGYPSGMNLTLPGSKDYESLGCFGSHEDKVRAGHIGGLSGGLTQGHNNTKSGHWNKVSSLGAGASWSITGREVRRKNGYRGTRSFSVGSQTAVIGSRIGICKRWNINRGKPCTCGKHTGGNDGKL